MLRDEFPVFERTAYLNAGTCGPVAGAAAESASAELARAARDGRTTAYFDRTAELREELRAAYAARLSAQAEDVAITTGTTDGIGSAVLGLALQNGDEILTSTDEHPGLYGALIAARDLAGVAIRQVPFDDVAAAVGDQTALVAMSHVSWIDGRTAPTALADLEVPVLLDGAQGVGAIEVDVAALGCDIYAGSGQKWLCGPQGLGMLWTSAAIRERLATLRPGYMAFEDPSAGLDSALHQDARRFDAPVVSAEALAFGLVAHDTLASAGWPEIHAGARRLAAAFADRLAAAGRTVAPRGDTTLVSFESSDPGAEKARLAAAGVAIRDLPGRPLLRASVGAWNDERDLERLLEGLGTPG